MPLYAKYRSSTGEVVPVQWGAEAAIEPLLVKNGNGRSEQLELGVSLKEETYPVKFFLVSHEGTPVILAEQPTVFEVLTSEERALAVQAAFLGRVYVELFKFLGVSPALLHVHDRMLFLAEVARANDIEFFKKMGSRSIHERTQLIFSWYPHEVTTTPLRYYAFALAKYIGEEMVPSWAVSDGKVYMATRLAERALVVVGLCAEHKEVLRRLLLPKFCCKIISILGSPDPEFWKSASLQAKEAAHKESVTKITPEELFTIATQRKEDLNAYLATHTGAGFSDTTRLTVGLVDMLVNFKEQGILADEKLLMWICGDRDREYQTPWLAMQKTAPGLGMNVLVGGFISLFAHFPK